MNDHNQNNLSAGPNSNGMPDGYEVLLAKSSANVTARPKVTIEERQRHEPEGVLTVDVYQTPTEIVVESGIAGVNPEDLDINVSRDSITIRGERKRETQIHDEDYLYQECYWGRFSRSIILPQEVEPESVRASSKNGILTVRLPKLVREKARKVKVNLE